MTRGQEVVMLVKKKEMERWDKRVLVGCTEYDHSGTKLMLMLFVKYYMMRIKMMVRKETRMDSKPVGGDLTFASSDGGVDCHSRLSRSPDIGGLLIFREIAAMMVARYARYYTDQAGESRCEIPHPISYHQFCLISMRKYSLDLSRSDPIFDLTPPLPRSPTPNRLSDPNCK